MPLRMTGDRQMLVSPIFWEGVQAFAWQDPSSIVLVVFIIRFSNVDQSRLLMLRPPNYKR